LKGHLEVLKIDHLLDGKTTADAADHSKPCPDIFEAALEVAGVEPGEAVVIGDSPWDAVAAARAGIPMIGVLTGGFREEELREKGARAVYRDLRELPI
ncbi:MAG: HAD family hydrolase, partial [Betaproteobacteria bacterium]